MSRYCPSCGKPCSQFGCICGWTAQQEHPPIYADEHGDWAAANRGAASRPPDPAVPSERTCFEPAPDRSGRTCDKPRGHDGDHWTYGGNTLTWAASRASGVSAEGAQYSQPLIFAARRFEEWLKANTILAATADEYDAKVRELFGAGASGVSEAGLREAFQAERERLHDIIQRCDALIDPERDPQLSADIDAVLLPCDEAGHCVAPPAGSPAAPARPVQGEER